MTVIRMALLLAALLLAHPGLAQEAASKHLASGFSTLPKGTKIVVMPTDIELFSISGGGVLEPRADWTESALKFFGDGLLRNQRSKGLDAVALSEEDADELAELNALHAAVARAISLHHFGMLSLPTKGGRLDWSLGDSVKAIRERTGADFALFSFVRDSYASEERKAAMVAIAILSMGNVVLGGGIQAGYASLVDLRSGRVLWFNQLVRTTGDLREPDKAGESLEALLDKFPVTQ